MFESVEASSQRALQPLLHDVVFCVAAPAFAASSRDGQLRGIRAEGFYDHDRRLLHTLCLLLDEREPEPIGVQPLGPHQVRFTAVHRYPRDRTDDPTLIVERIRTAGSGETISLRNIGTAERRLHVQLAAASDLADIADVKRGHSRPVLRCAAARASLAWRSPAAVPGSPSCPARGPRPPGAPKGEP